MIKAVTNISNLSSTSVTNNDIENFTSEIAFLTFLIHSPETSRDISKWRFVLMQFFLPRRYFPFTLCIDRDVAGMIDSQSVLSIWTDWKSFRKMKNVVKKYHKGTRKNSNQFPTHLTIPDFYLNLTKKINSGGFWSFDSRPIIFSESLLRYI